ncbi:MAG: hypothetical protein AB1941_11875 [Gemmatimonadota bacterium]
MRRTFTVPAVTLALALGACGDAPMQPERAAPAAARAPTGSPGEATASSVLTITNLYCLDVGGGGTYYNNTQCQASASGGTGSYAWNWDVIVNYQSDSGSSSYIQGVCTDSYPVSVRVTDSAGATATASQTFPCYASSTPIWGGGPEGEP